MAELVKDKLSAHNLYLKMNEKNAVLEFASRIRAEFGTSLHNIVLFGSKARGDSDKYSDIDILIVLDRLSWDVKCRISDIAAEENLKYNVVLSSVRYDTALWHNPVIQQSPFAMTVKAEGIPL